ncbi:dehydrodolichyl diphosphate synthase complex subunit nus1-like [Octopus bimaculoides]|uniref:dehydrodolichyl diphosphate synthase complex subunit nus1-like n=1 Tax=Octopus bimaculoides TaxID=37653 RepID=UPI00071D8ACA|nr:dehydrodolichyl diphosphate synthase complex subunit nus1-like [Octopus bimaculoides]|eukprot:XP_014775606.1 PREDICTED: dehydrodolichyl diphosphate syntase complex subunit nus1-like [Octopus bimaculoides]
MFLDRFLLRLFHYLLSFVSCIYDWWLKILQLRFLVFAGNSGFSNFHGFLYFVKHIFSCFRDRRKSSTITSRTLTTTTSTTATPLQLNRIRCDSKELKKLPTSLGLALNERDVSSLDICNIVLWSLVMGIPYISIYDIKGDLKRNSITLQNELLKKKHELFGPEANMYEIFVNPSSSLTELPKCGKQILVNILSLDDGRQSLVHIAQHLSEQVLQKQLKISDINPELIDRFYKITYGCPAPDLIIRFGKTESLLGFSPWQSQFSEILSCPSHVGLDYLTYLSTLIDYANSSQRCGK